MKVAVVYNRQSKSVINLFGLPNREKIGIKTIDRLTASLRDGGHQVIALEGDKDLVERLEEFMPRVVKGERPGLVFNVSYGIQGQARYTHVPSILEMVGVPYVASGPLAHSLCLDKVVTKMILRQNRLPTPDFAVLQTPDDPVDGLTYPLIVKPKNEAVSFGLKVVHDEAELREAAAVIFNEFRQAVLAEQFIEGREVNVGLLGNGPPEAFPPVELVFGEGGPAIYTYEDKTGRSGRTISHACPAPIGEALLAKARDLAVRAFVALGCADCARVDMRLDKDGNLYILEINSLPSLGEHGSYLVGAAAVGLDFTKFINRLVDVASARYFSAPHPPAIADGSEEPSAVVLSYVTERRDVMERRLSDWVNLGSRTTDPVGVRNAMKEVSALFDDLGMKPVEALSDRPSARMWQTAEGFDGGMLFIGNLDIPVDLQFPAQSFRRDPEWLYGEGVGSSRAPLVMLEFALRSLRSMRRLRHLPIGVLYYVDEGLDARYSADVIREAAARSTEVFVLRPGLSGDKIVTHRRGQRTYRLRVEGEPVRLGRFARKKDTLRWVWSKLEAMAALTSQRRRLSIATVKVETEQLPMRLPHRVTASIVANYPTTAAMEAAEAEMQRILAGEGPDWEFDVDSDRPPFVERAAGLKLADEYKAVGRRWDVALERESSAWPSVAGLVPADTACICGIGPVATDLRTPREAVHRLSLVQRTLLLAEMLAERLPR